MQVDSKDTYYQSLFNSVRFRYLAVTLLICFWLFASYHIFYRLYAYIHHFRGVHYSKSGDFNSAIYHLEKGVYLQPNDPKFFNSLGYANYRLSLDPFLDGTYGFALVAKKNYRKAVNLYPVNATSVLGLALSEAHLETFLYRMYKNETRISPYNALPFFEEAIRLYPNSFGYHHDFLSYLKKKNDMETFYVIVEKMAQRFPSTYHILKKDNEIWSDNVKEVIKEGINKAINEGKADLEIYEAMSYLLRDEGDFSVALSHYKHFLKHRKRKEDFRHLFHLGALYLDNGEVANGEDLFIKALSISKDRKDGLTSIFNAYRSKDFVEECRRFYLRVKESVLYFSEIDLLFAQTLMYMRRYDDARNILDRVCEISPTGEAYYWLARIAQNERDWKKMESASHKATVYTETNSVYHFLYSQALIKMDRFLRAEKEAGLAIKYSYKPSSDLFSHRAKIRYSRKDYSNAILDWKSAISLNSTNAHYYALLADSYYKLNDQQRAMENYKKAMSHDPSNIRYVQQYETLRNQRYK